MSAAIRDPVAFAVAFVRGIEHPSVRAVLDRRPHPGERKPDAVRLPIARILGTDGHRFYEGFQLAGDTDTARARTAPSVTLSLTEATVFPSTYWMEDKDAPFAFFLNTIHNYCHPESGSDEDELYRWVHYPEPRPDVGRFEAESRRLLSGELSQLPKGALGLAAEYDDGSDEAFLRRLWDKLFPGEQV